MSIPAEQTEVAAFLRRLAGADPIETHISLVYVGADTVWKLKKSVRLSFLDFTRLDDRRHFTERELALNRAAAPGLYRDVVPIRRTPDGDLTLDGSEDSCEDASDDWPVVDWVLRMSRIGSGDFLPDVAAQGRLEPPLLDAIGDAIAAYHTALAPLPDVLPDMRLTVIGNARAARDTDLPPEAIARWEAAVSTALDCLSDWARERSAAGFVRRGHGDLHLGNLCLWQGRPVPFDALEFDERLATTDIGYDLAFLLMDLDVRVSRAAANRVLNRYVARTADIGLVSGLPVFLSMRAMIRAHVDARTGCSDTASRYLGASLAYLSPPPPVVIAIGGLPGTGKSTLARLLAPSLGGAPGALIIRSDEIRKRQAGVAPEQRLPPSAYTPDASRTVFAELAEMTAAAATAGHAVIADATFMDPGHRSMVAAAARDSGTLFVGFWLEAPLAELERRVGARTGDASDATVDVLRSAARRDPGAGGWHGPNWHRIDTTDMMSARDLAIATLRPHVVSCEERKPELHNKAPFERS
jgi:aminoglycoside phosphotransferase family enzyme/predicted kinase